MINIKGLFQKGYKCHQAGNLEVAAQLYREIIEKQPGHVDAIFLLGTLNLQQGNLDRAAIFFKKTLSIKPDHVAAYNNLGTVLQEQGNLDEAVKSYRQTIMLNPDDTEAHYNLANTLKKQDKLDEAVKSYRQTIMLNPGYAEAYYNLANTLKKQGKLDEAVESYRQTIMLKPDYAEAHNNLGTVFQEQGKLDEAIASYEQAIVLKPDYAMAHNNLSTVFQVQGKLDEAVKNYRHAITLKPDYAEAYYNLGTVFQEQDKLDEAVESYRHAITLKPDYAEAHNNLGSMLQEQGKLDEAVESYRHAITLKPDYAEAHTNKSLTLLLVEDFEDGWPEYEWRLHSKDCTYHNFRQPRWDGSPLKGRSILVHAEQGLGDTIQFIRYLPMVKAQGGYVIFECQKPLHRLLKSCAGIDEIIERPLAQFDVHIPLLSLPGIFGTTLDTIPSKTPYISVDSNLITQWRMRLEHNNTFKVGIVWAGSPKHKKDRKRSCSMADFALLADIPGLTFCSLQKGPASVETMNPPERMKLINLENDLNDFADTAAVIANLDLVISVDTAVAHLAGAINKPVWNLLYFAPDWRWLLKRNDSPWYPSMRLFRQTHDNDWTGVFERVKEELLAQLSNNDILKQEISQPNIQMCNTLSKKSVF